MQHFTSLINGDATTSPNIVPIPATFYQPGNANLQTRIITPKL